MFCFKSVRPVNEQISSWIVVRLEMQQRWRRVWTLGKMIQMVSHLKNIVKLSQDYLLLNSNCKHNSTSVKILMRNASDFHYLYWIEVRVHKASWEPTVLSTIGKEIHYFAGHEIRIWESLDSFGSVIWPAVRQLICNIFEILYTTLFISLDVKILSGVSVSC